MVWNYVCNLHRAKLFFLLFRKKGTIKNFSTWEVSLLNNTKEQKIDESCIFSLLQQLQTWIWVFESATALANVPLPLSYLSPASMFLCTWVSKLKLVGMRSMAIGNRIYRKHRSPCCKHKYLTHWKWIISLTDFLQWLLSHTDGVLLEN